MEIKTNVTLDEWNRVLDFQEELLDLAIKEKVHGAEIFLCMYQQMEEDLK